MTQQEILQNLGIDLLNTMQQETIAAFRRCRQLVLLSPTGSGKTLAYLLPLIEELQRTLQRSSVSQGNSASVWPGALVLVPSRELALQTVDVIRAMKCGLRALACYGGRPAMDEHRVLREVQPHIIVATPGRAADHLRKQNFDGSAVRCLIIDEFDKSLELGFHDEMESVMGMLPRIERRFLLSATDSEQIPAFVGEGFQKLDFTEPHDLETEAAGKLIVHLVHSPEKDKLHTLRALLCHLGTESSIVFVNYRESVERVADYLRHEGFACSAFHGGMEQRDRERALYRFVGGAALTLVSTDLAARGLDIDNVRHIIHYHLPLNEDAFTHRNGRTARWDREGDAWVIIDPPPALPCREGVVTSEGRAPWNKVVDEWTVENGWLIPNDSSSQIHSTPLPSRVARGKEVDLTSSSPSDRGLTPKPRTDGQGGGSLPLPHWTTLYIGKGKKDKINKVDIVGFLSKVGGLRREELGRVDVGDHWAYAAIVREKADQVLSRVRGMKIKGVKTLIEKAR